MKPWGCPAIATICRRALTAVAAFVVLWICSWDHSLTANSVEKLPPAATKKIDFVKDVQPLFVAKCYSCHGPKKQESSFRLDHKASALRGGEIGRAIVSGKSAESPLIRYVAGLDPDIKMPPEGDRLSAEQVGILRAWIDQGVDWPESASLDLDSAKKNH